MLSVFRGHSTRYLTDEVAKAREGYYTGAVAAGEPPGRWWGAGAETLGLAGEVDADLMEAVYTKLLDPRDPAAHDKTTWDEAAALSVGHRKYKTAEQIYAGLLENHPTAGPAERAQLRAQATRSARQAVAFIDVTLSVPKSITVTGLAFERAATEARNAGDVEAAQAWDAHAKAVEDAMMAGAQAMLDYLQEHAGYSRVGHHGGGAGRWIDAHQLVVAQFLQHDSRERDPQWHIHNAILNRVLCSDGVWRGLDGRAIDEHKAAAGALAERVMEAYLARSLGVRVETRPDGKAREVVGVDADPLGAAPGPSRVEHRMMFRAAHEALALAEAGEEEAGMTDGRLRNRYWAYERERAWAPRWVADDLAAAHERRARVDADATLRTAHADAPGTDPADAVQLRAEAAKARAEAEQLAQQIVELEAADQAWAEWYAHTAVTRDLAERSRIELRARGVDVDNPPDRTTAPDWLAAHRDAQDDHDRHAEITEADIHDDATNLVDDRGADDAELDHRHDERPETDVADVRDVAVRDANETADPVRGRHVLTDDETTRAVTRARTALNEITARRAAEAERAAAEAERAEADAERRDQLDDWAADDTAVDSGGAAALDRSADEYVEDGAALER